MERALAPPISSQEPRPCGDSDGTAHASPSPPDPPPSPPLPQHYTPPPHRQSPLSLSSSSPSSSPSLLPSCGMYSCADFGCCMLSAPSGRRRLVSSSAT